jgi:hypothetical protein
VVGALMGDVHFFKLAAMNNISFNTPLFAESAHVNFLLISNMSTAPASKARMFTYQFRAGLLKHLIWNALLRYAPLWFQSPSDP